jgi:hypothetical protein
VNPQNPQHGEQLHQKIVKLIGHLENEVSDLKAKYPSEIESLAMRCRKDMQKVQLEFSNELDEIERKHNVQLSSLAEEIAYLKEMSQSQRLMMETNLEYINELELRYLNLMQAKQS